MPSSLRVTVHRGSRQIGGSCVEIATDTHRVLIDAGAPLDDSLPRTLPPIAGVSLPGKPPDAVLLSHAHADHSGLLASVPSIVPVFLTSGTSKMLMAGEVFCRQPALPRDRQCKLDLRRAERIGDITVTTLPVDHSIFGAVAFLIEAAGRRVLYSGDLRLHGREPGMTRGLIEVATAAPLDLLLIEGTHLSRQVDAVATTEWELEEQIASLVAAAPALVLAFLSPQHLQRLLGFYHAAVHGGRTFVIDLYTAFILHLLRFEAGIPDPANSPNLRVYFPVRHKSIPRVEKRLVGARITLDEVLARPERHVLLCRPSMLAHDLGGRLPAKTLGLYSMWHGYLDRDEWQQTQHTIAEGGGSFVECHTSGHATVPDLVKLIRDLRPRRIVPIHTERPEVLKQLVPGVEIAEDGQPIILAMNVSEPTPDLLENISDLIDTHLRAILGRGGRAQDHKMALIGRCHDREMALRLLEIARPQAELTALIFLLFETICSNWMKGQNDRGKDNWRWIPSSEKLGRKETMWERKLMLAANGTPTTGRWVNQIPTGSGLSPIDIPPTTGAKELIKKRRARNTGHIDLAYCDVTGRLIIVEFKLNADNPVAAAFQLVRYALVLILAREKGLKIKNSRWRDAKRIDLRVLAPINFDCAWHEQFYDRRYELQWFEDRLKDAVVAFGQKNGIKLSFGFSAFDWASPPKSENDLLRCLSQQMTFPTAL